MTLLPDPWPEVPALAELYDAECVGRHDDDFYLDLAAELGAGTLVDLGCGTGVFAVAAARRGLTVVGVDPAGAVLDVARARPGGDLVHWVQGDLDALTTAGTDLVVMMGHVAQYHVSDEAWGAVLAGIGRILVPGGRLAFETRNPAIDWSSRWTRERTTAAYRHPGGGRFTSWVEVIDLAGAPTSYAMTHEGNTVLPDGTHLRAVETLRFRSPDEVIGSLGAAGFHVEHIWGDWERGPFTSDSEELIVLATAGGPPS